MDDNSNRGNSGQEKRVSREQVGGAGLLLAHRIATLYVASKALILPISSDGNIFGLFGGVLMVFC